MSCAAGSAPHDAATLRSRCTCAVEAYLTTDLEALQQPQGGLLPQEQEVLAGKLRACALVAPFR